MCTTGKSRLAMYGQFPFMRFHPVSRAAGRGRGDRQAAATAPSGRGRPFVNERTNTAIKSSSIRRGSCQNFGLLGGRATLSFAGCPGMKIAPLLSLSLPRSSHGERANANKYGTHKSVSHRQQSRNLSDVLCIHPRRQCWESAEKSTCYTCHK